MVGAQDKMIGSKERQGAAYAFVRSGITWSQQKELTASDGAAGDRFGISVAVSGDTAVVGAPQQDFALKGLAYVFVRSGITWSQQQELTASDGADGDYFGGSVAVSGDTALVGAPQYAAATKGAAYAFGRSGITWSQRQKLTASDGVAQDSFGSSVAVSGETAVVGAQGKTIGSNGDTGRGVRFYAPGARLQ